MTSNEKKLLIFLNENPFSTYREMVEGVGLSDVTSAVYVVNSLINKGLLRKDERQKSRSIRITEEGYRKLIGYKNRQINHSVQDYGYIKIPLSYLNLSTNSIDNPSQSQNTVYPGSSWYNQDGNGSYMDYREHDTRLTSDAVWSNPKGKKTHSKAVIATLVIFILSIGIAFGIMFDDDNINEFNLINIRL